MEFDASGWSGEGAFTQVLIDALKALPDIRFLRVEDAPASRSEAAFSFISNELYVAFAHNPRSESSMSELASRLSAIPAVGSPDYEDDSMLQYLRTERIVPAYQTRGYKLVELVRLYRAGSARSRAS